MYYNINKQSKGKLRKQPPKSENINSIVINDNEIVHVGESI